MKNKNRDKGDLRVFPDILPSSIETSTFRIYEAGDFESREDVDNLITLLFKEPECCFYYFVEKGGVSSDNLLMRAQENGDILINKTDFFYYKHPERERDYLKIEVCDGNFEWDWQKEMVEKGPMFMRMTLGLSHKKRTEMEILQKISFEEDIRLKQPGIAKDTTKNEPVEASKNVPDGLRQIIVHCVWPADTLLKKVGLGLFLSCSFAFIIWASLPEKTKLDFIDWAKTNIMQYGTQAKNFTDKDSAVHYKVSTFRSKVFIEGDSQGRLMLSGGEGITSLTQFCPEDWTAGCPPNIDVNRSGDLFELNQNGLAQHQTAFNFQDAASNWLLLPDDQNITLGKNVTIQQGAKGSYFVYRLSQKTHTDKKRAKHVEGDAKERTDSGTGSKKEALDGKVESTQTGQYPQENRFK